MVAAFGALLLAIVALVIIIAVYQRRHKNSVSQREQQQQQRQTNSNEYARPNREPDLLKPKKGIDLINNNTRYERENYATKASKSAQHKILLIIFYYIRICHHGRLSSASTRI